MVRQEGPEPGMARGLRGLAFERLHPEDFARYLLGCGERRASGPAVERLVPEAHDPDVLLEFCIRDRIGIDKAELAAEQLDVVRRTRKELPTRSDSEGIRIGLE